MMAMSLTAQDKKMIVEREVKDIEDLFKQSVKQLYGWVVEWFVMLVDFIAMLFKILWKFSSALR